MDASKGQENTYTNALDEGSIAFSKLSNSLNEADRRSEDKKEFTVDDKFSKAGYNSLDGGKDSDGKWKTLRTGLIVIVVIIAFIGFCLGLVAVVKILNDTQTELSALKQKNAQLKENFGNLTMNFRSLNGKIANFTQILASTRDDLVSNEEKRIADDAQIRRNLTKLTKTFNRVDLTANCSAMNVSLPVPADPGWYTPNNGYQYKLNSGYQTWNNSRKFCKRIGGDLAAVGMRDYSTRVVIGAAVLSGSRRVWIGLHDTTLEGRFLWVDGVVATDSNAHWNKDEPNNAGNNEDCSEIIPTGSIPYGTNDLPCTNRVQGICEKPLRSN